MTKQEEIREGIAIILESAGASKKWTLNILEFLRSQGVVIKVDRELPDKNANNTWYDDDLGEAGKIGWELGVEDMLKAGYVAIEPLIKEQ